MREVKEKAAPSGKRPMRKAAGVPQQAAEEAKARIQEQLRPFAATDSPEEYGGDQIEHGAEYVAGRAERTVKDLGSHIKDKASEKIRDRRSENRVRENREHGEGNVEPNTASEPGIRQKPEADKEHAVKTKENYVRTETGEDVDYVREKPYRRPDLNQADGIHAREKTDAAGLADKPAYSESHTYQGGKEFAEKQAEQRIKTRESVRQSSRHVTADTGAKTVKTAERSPVKTGSKAATKTAESSVKAADRTVKTAQKSAETTAKAAKATAKTAQKSAESAAKAVKATAQAAARAAKIATKSMAAAFRAIVAGIKSLVTAIAAGGWVAVAVIAGIALVGLFLCTAFGVFTADETEDGSKPLSEAVAAIDAEFQAQMDGQIAALSTGEYDEVVVDYIGDIDGDSAYVNNWNDVLAAYAVLLTTDSQNATDAVTVTPEKVELLRKTFFEMNAVEYDSEVVEEELAPDPDAPQTTPAPDDESATKTVLYIYVTVNNLDYRDAADLYAMTDDQREVLDEMMSAEFASLFATLVGVDVTGGVDLTQIVSGLPANAKGSEVVKAALTRLGAPYVWGAKGESKFDCSGLVYWSIKKADAALGDRMYTNAAGQAKYCNDRGLTVGESELLPGDLVFWQNLRCTGCHRWEEVHHTGIYIGGGKVIEASSGKGRVVIRDLWSTENYPIYLFGRPY